MSLEQQPPAPRASDRDRDQAAALIQEAHGDGRLDLEEMDERLSLIYAAKTQPELKRVTADLVPALPIAHGGTSDVLELHAKHSSQKREGQWQVPPRIVAYAEHSSVKLDFTQAVLRTPEVHVEAEAKHGSVVLLVPEGWIIDVDEVATNGGSVKNKAVAPRADGVRLRITGVAKWSSIVIRHPRRRRWWWPWYVK
jgi:hypothetical protein